MSVLQNGIELLNELDTRTDYGDAVTVRRVWQQLFNCYRMFGGDLNNLDNLVVDLANIEKVFREQPEQFVVAWYMTPEVYFTSFTDRDLFTSDEEMDACHTGTIRLKLSFNREHHRVLIELTHLE